MEIRLTINSKSIDVLMLNMFNSHGNDFASGCFVYLVCCSATHLTPFNFVQMILQHCKYADTRHT